MIAKTTSLYRCADCSHGKHLTAWAASTVHGPLGADGELDSHDWEDDYQTHEESIQCTRHPDSAIERLVDGIWCRWWNCIRCGGEGCPAESPLGKVHAGWRPAAEARDLARVWPGLGPGHVLDVDLHFYRPGLSATPMCRICDVNATFPKAERPCEGDQHHCPAVITGLGESPDATQRYGSEVWFCNRPGQMNEDFTTWTCTGGHATGADHVENARQWRHDQDCVIGCPWPQLTRQASARFR